MDFKEDLNCSIIASNKNPDGMSLREIGERLKLTCTRVKQIQDKALEKLSESVRIINWSGYFEQKVLFITQRHFKGDF